MENLLQCPKCFSDLRRELPHFKCDDCGNIVPTIGAGVPIFIDDFEQNAVKSHKHKNISKGIKAKISIFIKRMAKIFISPHHSVYSDLRNSHGEGAELKDFLKKLPSDAKILNIGSLSKSLKGLHEGIKNLDICYYPNVDFVADAGKLPFKDNSLDAILLVNVLEHVKSPNDVLKHIKRALKPGGYLYVKIPFLQPFHAVPDDYQRYTANGISELFKDYHKIDFGISVGPSSMLSWITREYLAILTSFGNKKLYKLGIHFWGWITFWIKYFDIFMKKNRMAGRLASCFYAIYRKPCD